jgi:hypothetical protein
MVDAGWDSGPPELDASLDALIDAPLVNDTGVDVGVDAGSTCADGLLSPDESDVDCGGSCSPCNACRRCRIDTDCTPGSRCTDAQCEPVTSTTRLSDGTEIAAFLREDGAILVAHYDAKSYVSAFDPFVAQAATPSGGAGASAGFAPLPCGATGHLDLDRFLIDTGALEFQCGTSQSDVRSTITSNLISSFRPGDFGSPGTVGEPGWANIAAVGSGLGRSRFGSCGNSATVESGGIAYCSGPFASDYSNHLVSYTVANDRAYVGCDSMGCSGASCELEVWIWLKPGD